MSPEYKAFTKDALKQEFGSILGRNLSLQGVTPEELMEKTGKKKGSLNKWNNGDSLPAPDTFDAIMGLMPNLPEENRTHLLGLWNKVQATKGTRR